MRLFRAVSLPAVVLTCITISRPAPCQDLSALALTREQQSLDARAHDLWSSRLDSTPVLFSFSGGISLGAYQAGVNWVMIETAKRTLARNSPDALRDLTGGAPVDLKPIPILAMSGASAGNVNVLLASIEYCDASLSKGAEQSLFWEMWVKSGWNELFPPEGRGADPGALDRSHSFARLYAAVDSATWRRHFARGCRLPLGVVVTRLRPVKVSLDRNLSYETQRFVALFEAHESGGTLQFVRPAAALLLREPLGVQMVLKAGSGNVISLSDVFEVVKASSSYPIAFAPVSLTYDSPGCALGGGCTGPITAKFLDGGVFDNNPVGLVVGMHDALVPGVRTAGAVSDSVRTRIGRTRVLFVDPGAATDDSPLQRRQHELETRDAEHEAAVPNGAGALTTFAGGFVPSSRKYELQAFARSQKALDTSLQVAIRSSSRSRAVIGEHLNAFAAFLGQPFREHDFYIGVADGIRFVASEILCSENRPWIFDRTLESRIPAASRDAALIRRARDECTATQVARLSHGVFPLDSVGRRVVQTALHREYSTLKVDTLPNLAGQSLARTIVLDALEQASDWKLHAPLPDEMACSTGPFLSRALCSDGFNIILDSLRKSKAAMQVLECSDGGSCNAGVLVPGVEQTYAITSQPTRTLDRYLTQSLMNMRQTEQDEELHGRPDNWSTKMKLAEMIYRSADDPDGFSYDWGPSSVPRFDEWRSRVFGAAPYFAGPTLGGRGFQMGWQPTLHTGFKGVVLQAPFGTVRLPRFYPAEGSLASAVVTTPGVGVEFRGAFLNQVSLGARVESHGRLFGGQFGVHTPLPEFSAYLLGRRLRFNLYQLPADRTSDGIRRWMGGISLADVNGMAYWVLR